MKTVNLGTLEEDITGTFLEFLKKGGVDVNDFTSLAKVKHNTFDRALMYVCDVLFKADRGQINNQKSLLPYDNLEVIKELWYIYYKLCTITNNDCTLKGYANMTGYDYSTLKMWAVDELNPDRLAFFKTCVKDRQTMVTNKLSDSDFGNVALANNDKELGFEWAKNGAHQVTKSTVFILPGEQARRELPGQNAAGLPLNDIQ